MYAGVRAGGGIGDELEDPAGDPYELYRVLFDITFFFFIIVILLAIIQGRWRRWEEHALYRGNGAPTLQGERKDGAEANGDLPTPQV